MRRPSPLPPPTAQPIAPEPVPRRRPAPPVADATAGSSRRADPPEHDGGDTAVILPLAATDPISKPLAGVDDEPAHESAVGAREVWAAARARRKALRSEVRRFTGRQRRRRAWWVIGAASVVVLVLGTLGAAYSPLFAVEQISIVGTESLDAAAVQAALSDQLGTPLPLVDESAVKAALVTFPLVESYTIEARPPHELVVRIVERTPVGLVQTPAGYSLVDAAGVVLSTTQTPAAGVPLLTIDGGTDSAAFASVGQVMRSLPDSIRAQVTAVSATTPDDVTLTLGGVNAQVVWGSADESALKAVNLEKAMAARPPDTVSVYDVTSPGSVVFR